MSSDQEIAFFHWALPRLGYRRAGFRKPRSQVIGRIRNRMQQLQFSGGYAQYKSYLQDNPAEWDILDKLFDVTISKFFRDRKLWDFLRQDLIQELLISNQSGPLRFWSAGCCNGEEPYSIAMTCEMIAEETGPIRPCSILATDRNPDVLKRARQGIYPRSSLLELTDSEIQRFFSTTQNEDREEVYRLRKSLKQQPVFEQRDIREEIPGQTIDFIFCRNLAFTYFNATEQARYLDRIYPVLDNSGYLIIGRDEKIPQVNWLKPLQNQYSIYQKIAYD